MGVDALIAKGWTRDEDGILRPPRTGKCPESKRILARQDWDRIPIIACFECGRELTAAIRHGVFVTPIHLRSR